jgi:hypothetical protein
MRLKRAIIGATIGAVLIAGGTTIAVASIPDSSGVIHACLKDGKLRVIDSDAGQTCTASEQALSWNQTGPAGSQGPAGTNGFSGYKLIRMGPVSFTGNDLRRVEVQCPEGKVPLGGGWLSSNPDDLKIWGSAPMYLNADGVNGWRITMQGRAFDSAYNVYVYVTCADGVMDAQS